MDQLIVKPTHFTENSSSILDLVSTTNKCNILSSGVGDPFLEHNIRFHCPINFVLNFCKTVTPVLLRNIWLYDRGDCQVFSQNIIETNLVYLKNNDIDIYASNITDKISELAKKNIPNKTVKIRQSDPTWLTSEIKKMIRKRKRLYNKFKRSKSHSDFEK